MRNRLYTPLAALLCAVWAWTGCSVDRYPLPPVAKVSETGFGAGDTTWLPLGRSIELGADAVPIGLFINDDGHVYVADSAQGRIRVFDQSLAEIGEPGLEAFHLPGVRGLCVGPEQLLLAVDGGATLWAHNLQARRETLVWGLRGVVVRHEPGGAPDSLDAAGIAELIAQGRLGQVEILALDSLDLDDPALQERLQPHAFWSGASSTRLMDVAPGRAGRREIFLANDNPFGSRINRLLLEPDAVLFTTNPEVPVVYLYAVTGSEVAVSSGTGVGSVDGILSLDADAVGSLHLCQRAATVGSWKVQRLTVEEFAGIDYWSFDFSLLTRPMMEAERFVSPVDIAWTATSLFVVDRREDGHRVQVFRRNGDPAVPLGATRVLVPDTSWVEGQPQVELRKAWRYDQLGDPRSVAIYGNRSQRAGNDDEVVFVVDGPRIRRFQLSVSLDDLPTP
jgi:hypothetical protein